MRQRSKRRRGSARGASPAAKKNKVARSTFLQACAHGPGLDGKSAVPHAVLESAIGRGGPDRKHTARLERGVRTGQTSIVVNGGIAHLGKRAGAVVDIEQHRIEPGWAGSQRGGDVADLDGYAPILERMVGQRSQWAAVPFHDCRQ